MVEFGRAQPELAKVERGQILANIGQQFANNGKAWPHLVVRVWPTPVNIGQKLNLAHVGDTGPFWASCANFGGEIWVRPISSDVGLLWRETERIRVGSADLGAILAHDSRVPPHCLAFGVD